MYGEPQHLPIAETHPLSATNPYGRSKLFIEDMLRDLHRADPQGVPNNLMPFVAQVAVGLRPQLQIWGNDYPTPMAPVFATTFTWWIWPKAMSKRCRPWLRHSASRSTWAQALATVCST